LQWFLSESTWDAETINERRIAVLREDPVTAPTEDGVLVIDEHGDRKWGSKTAHIGKQYLANLGKIDTGVVSVTSLWADEHVYYPLHVAPYTPAHHFPQGKADPAFRTKLTMAVELVRRAVDAGIPFRAVVADCFYGEDRGVQQGIRELGVGYVLALKPSHAWWHPIDTIGSLQDAAEAAGWKDSTVPGAWRQIERGFRDGHTETWCHRRQMGYERSWLRGRRNDRLVPRSYCHLCDREPLGRFARFPQDHVCVSTNRDVECDSTDILSARRQVFGFLHLRHAVTAEEARCLAIRGPVRTEQSKVSSARRKVDGTDRMIRLVDPKDQILSARVAVIRPGEAIAHAYLHASTRLPLIHAPSTTLNADEPTDGRYMSRR